MNIFKKLFMKSDISNAAHFDHMLIKAKQGDAQAQSDVGVCYLNGIGVEKNYSEAIKWCKLSAEQGNAIAQNSLGVMYEEGRGVPKSSKEALKWYRLAAKQGDAGSQDLIGCMYFSADAGLDRDIVRAYMWAYLAAMQDDKIAKGNLQTYSLYLTQEQIELAKKMAKSCLVSNFIVDYFK
jgi:TPR repeat protein